MELRVRETFLGRHRRRAVAPRQARAVLHGDDGALEARFGKEREARQSALVLIEVRRIERLVAVGVQHFVGIEGLVRDDRLPDLVGNIGTGAGIQGRVDRRVARRRPNLSGAVDTVTICYLLDVHAIPQCRSKFCRKSLLFRLKT